MGYIVFVGVGVYLHLSMHELLHEYLEQVMRLGVLATCRVFLRRSVWLPESRVTEVHTYDVLVGLRRCLKRNRAGNNDGNVFINGPAKYPAVASVDMEYPTTR